MSKQLPILSPQTNTGRRSQRLAEGLPALGMPVVTLVAAAILAGCGGGDDDPPATPPGPTPVSAQAACNAFLGRSLEGAVVTRASLVAVTADIPEHCIVYGEMPQDLDFEVRMPTEWNRRTVFLGGGGFDGIISDPNALHFSPGMSQAGYVTVSTNHGHNASTLPGATFAADEQMLSEYGYLAVPRVMSAVKAILRERYGDTYTGTKIVYEGCSGGGRQGLIQAQRFPDLFDGVISRAPANAYTPQFLSYQKIEKQLAQPGAALSNEKIRTIGNAVMAKCDALDGLADKIIGRPDACTFDPAELACTGAETDSCLTPAQMQSARTFTPPPALPMADIHGQASRSAAKQTRIPPGVLRWLGVPRSGPILGRASCNTWLPGILLSIGSSWIRCNTPTGWTSSSRRLMP